jgi:hypothetical protein
VLGGRILASLALGIDDGWSRCGLVRDPDRGGSTERWRDWLRLVSCRSIEQALSGDARAVRIVRWRSSAVALTQRPTVVVAKPYARLLRIP